MSQRPGQPKTLQIGVVLPPPEQYREGNLKDRLAASMPLYLDHHDIPGVTAVGLAIAHPHRGTAFCLVEAPTRAAWNQCTCKASAETAVRHQPKLRKASAEHVLSCFSRIRTLELERETRLELATSTLGRSRSTN